MTRTIATLMAAMTIAAVATPTAAQTKYFARERLERSSTNASHSAPAGPSSCDAPKRLWTIKQYDTLKRAGTTNFATIEEAEAACETETGIAVCYVIETLAKGTPLPFAALTSPTGRIEYYGLVDGHPSASWASVCRPTA
jgi:hypothetical protein